MAVLVLCAGLGTRLRPLTDHVPKPLHPIGDRPVLAHVLPRVAAFGGRVVVNAHHHRAQLKEFLGREARDVLLSEEAELLGTGGGLRRAVEVAGEPAAGEDFLVWNGDTLAELDVVGLRAAHRSGPGSAGATLVVRAAPGGAARGNVGVDGSGRVVRLRKEVVIPGETRAFDFTGIHVVGAELLAHLPRVGGLIEDFYLPLVARGAVLATFELPSPFHDIGTPAGYLEANLAWLAASGRDSFVAASANVDPGVAAAQAIIGAGARVAGAGHLRRCVVWPGATARAPRQDAIVTPFGEVDVWPLLTPRAEPGRSR